MLADSCVGPVHHVQSSGRPLPDGQNLERTPFCHLCRSVQVAIDHCLVNFQAVCSVMR